MAGSSKSAGPDLIQLNPDGPDSSGKSISTADLLAHVQTILEDGKAEDIVTIDLAGKSSLSDALVITSGRSARHVSALTDQLLDGLRKINFKGIRPEGAQFGDWVLLDVGPIVVHVFRPEVREFYNLERLWSESRPMEDDEA